MSRWEGIDLGRRPTKEDLIPTMIPLINLYAGDSLTGLGMPTSTLKRKLEKLQIDVLFVLHETLVNMQSQIG